MPRGSEVANQLGGRLFLSVSSPIFISRHVAFLHPKGVTFDFDLKAMVGLVSDF